MKDNSDLKETYNKIAENWNIDHEKDDWWTEGTNIFLSFLPKNADVLDIGCAGGNKTNYIKQKGFEIEGVDFSESMIEEAKKRFPNIHFELWDVYKIDRYPKKFNAIFCEAVLLHIPKEEFLVVLKKIISRLNNNGILHIALKKMKENGIEEEIKKENDYGFNYERFFSYFNEEELRSYFKEAGLEILSEKIISSGRSNWINIIGKK